VAIDRPELVAQRDSESILPTTGVGVMVQGRIAFGHQAVSYDLALTNGRGRTSAEITNAADPNNAKAVNLRLRYEIHGFIIGGNASFDVIPPRVAAPAQPEALKEQIFGGHLAYVEHPWHLIAEMAVIRHVGAAATFTSVGGLGEIGYAIHQVMPYARLETARFPAATDPFWAATTQQARGNYYAVSAGAKWNINENVALKLELERNHADTDTFYSAVTQLAFGF
jgi:opacity protein-like surface antigen